MAYMYYYYYYDHSTITGILGLVNASAPVVFPSQILHSTKPGVWSGLGMDLHTVQV